MVTSGTFPAAPASTVTRGGGGRGEGPPKQAVKGSPMEAEPRAKGPRNWQTSVLVPRATINCRQKSKPGLVQETPENLRITTGHEEAKNQSPRYEGNAESSRGNKE